MPVAVQDNSDWEAEFNFDELDDEDIPELDTTDTSSSNGDEPPTSSEPSSDDGIAGKDGDYSGANNEVPLTANNEVPLTAETIRRGASNELAALRRQADRLKLTPYQKANITPFFKSSTPYQLTTMYLQQCGFDNRLDALIAAAPPFQISSALLANIRSTVTAVLLSSKLCTYKGKRTSEHCWGIIVGKGLYLPPNFKRDQAAVNVLQKAISDDLTQTRSKFKKIFKKHLNDPIHDLTSALVVGSRTPITLALCARISYLRKMYTLDPAESFWDSVDLRLAAIRDKYKDNSNPNMVTRFFRNVLREDENKYGGVLPSFESITTSADDLAQDDIDDFIQGAHGVALS